MKIKIISPQIAEVVLSSIEASDLGISYNSLNSDSPSFRSAITKILKEVDDSTDLNHRSCSLCVEASPTEEGGIKLCLTFIEINDNHLFSIKGPLGPAVFHFSSQENLSLGCNKIAKSYLHRIYKSSLFSLNGNYFLVVYPLDTVDSRTIGFLSEYGSMLGTGNILASYIAEHSKLLIADNAIDIWSELDL